MSTRVPPGVVWAALNMPAARAVRDPLVVGWISTLLDVLQDASRSDDEAYAVFRRTVGLLAVYADEGRRR
jgi:hypothetical protein